MFPCRQFLCWYASEFLKVLKATLSFRLYVFNIKYFTFSLTSRFYFQVARYHRWKLYCNFLIIGFIILCSGFRPRLFDYVFEDFKAEVLVDESRRWQFDAHFPVLPGFIQGLVLILTPDHIEGTLVVVISVLGGVENWADIHYNIQLIQNFLSSRSDNCGIFVGLSVQKHGGRQDFVTVENLGMCPNEGFSSIGLGFFQGF